MDENFENLFSPLWLRSGVFREQRSRAWSQRHSVPGLSGEPIVNSPVIVRVYADEFYVDISCYVRT